MKATVKQIFNEISYLNPKASEISSLGTYISRTDEICYEETYKSIINNLPKESAAYNILINTLGTFSTNQLWAIAYELEKNDAYAEASGNSIAAKKAAADAKASQSKAKLTANKSASQSVLDCVKTNGLLLKDYYAFVKNTKKFAKEFYSKKYTQASADAFISSVKDYESNNKA